MKKTYSKKAVGSTLLVITLVAAAGFMFTMKYKSESKRVHSTAPVRVQVKGSSFVAVNNELKVCYESMVIRNPATDDGNVLFHMTLNQAGTVSFLKLIHSDFAENQFIDCVTEKIKEMRTQVPDDRVGVLIAHKFKFHRRDEAQMDFE